MRLGATILLCVNAACSGPAPPLSGVEVYQDGYRYRGQMYSSIEELAADFGDEAPAITVAECESDQRLIDLMEYLRDRGYMDAALISAGGLDCTQ